MSSPSPSQRLLRTFRKGRALLFSFALMESFVAALVGLVLCAALSLALFEILPFTSTTRYGFWALLAGGPLLFSSLLLLLRGRRLTKDESVAMQLEHAAKRRGVTLDDSIRSAAAFLQSNDATPGSQELKEAHIAQSVRRLDESGAFFSLAAVGLESALATLTVAFFAFFAAGLSLALYSDVLNDRFAHLFDDEVAKDAIIAQAKSEIPVVNDLQIALVFPAYQNRKPVQVTGASGSILAPKGTQITLRGRSDRPFKSAILLLGEKKIIAEKEGTLGVKARFVVEKEEEYRFQLKEPSGFKATDPVGHRIQLQLDEAPKVELTEDKTEKDNRLLIKKSLEKKSGQQDSKKEDDTTTKDPLLPSTGQKDLEIRERIIQLDDELTLQGSATDDFGIVAFHITILKNDDDESFRKEILKLPKPLKKMRARGSFTAREAGARPGDVLVVALEVLDNDDVTGPNIGRSTSRTYRVFSASRHHREIIERQQELLDAMVDSLAHDLLHPLPSRGQTQKRNGILLGGIHKSLKQHQRSLRLLEQVVVDLEQDELRPKGVLEALLNMRAELRPLVSTQRHLSERMQKNYDDKKKILAFAWRRLKQNQRERVQRLERHILFLEDLLNQQRLDETRQLGEELKQSQAALAELIDQYKKSGDEADRKRLLDEIKRMRKKMEELMERLSMLRREVPDEYLNHEAFETSEMKEQAKSLDELVESGDLDKAAEALNKMIEQTQKMVSELDESRERYGDDEYREQREKLERFGEELSALEKTQQSLVEKTQSMMKSAQKEAERQMKASFKDKLSEIQKEVGDALKALEEIDGNLLSFSGMDAFENSKARLADVVEALARKDIEEALQAVLRAEMHLDELRLNADNQLFPVFRGAKEQARNNLEQTDESREHALQARELLEEVMPDPAKMLSPPQRRQLQRDAKKQDELQKRAQELGQKMQSLGEEMPIFGPEHRQKLQEAGQAMRRAGGSLKSEDLREARRHQEGARNNLKELRETLEQMGEQGGSGGMPMALPSSGMGGKGDGSSGRHRDDDEVEIPDADAYQVPDAYRRDILDAMREDAPEGWQGEVKRYYEELVK
ncbi:MAG: hypothetical protein GY822_25065 [Deltaproteobacteria bacterium]|nr:hypothetical protein [Deltaproteobacteria bacterium]